MHECGGARSSTDLLDRMAAARDLWPRTTLGAWLGESGPPLPERVLWPEDTEQVEAALRAASEAGVSVTTYGAGSGVCGGATGQAGAWVLDTKALNRIGPMDSQRWVVEVEAGVNGQQLEDWLQARGFTLGHSPSSISCSTVGGWGAARSAGQFSSLYGVFEDMSTFNGDISKWNVGKVTDMGGMFEAAKKFNSDISKWNVGNVKLMDSMF